MGPLFVAKIKEMFLSRVPNKVSNDFFERFLFSNQLTIKNLIYQRKTTINLFGAAENYREHVRSTSLFPLPMQVSLNPATGQLLDTIRIIDPDV